jgi:hypothetical protein
MDALHANQLFLLFSLLLSESPRLIVGPTPGILFCEWIALYKKR